MSHADSGFVGSIPQLYERYLVPLNRIPAYVRQAFISAEDDSFYQHQGVDTNGILRAIVNNLIAGGDWGIYGLHLPGGFRSWERVKGPKKMLMAPPTYLERPVYQLQYESLRWFDHWLKGIDNGVDVQAPFDIFVIGDNTWRKEREWPLARTVWTNFYLRQNGRRVSESPAKK